MLSFSEFLYDIHLQQSQWATRMIVSNGGVMQQQNININHMVLSNLPIYQMYPNASTFLSLI